MAVLDRAWSKDTIVDWIRMYGCSWAAGRKEVAVALVEPRLCLFGEEGDVGCVSDSFGQQGGVGMINLDAHGVSMVRYYGCVM